MKIKKLISSVLAAVCAAAITVIPVCAEDNGDSAENATYCFDSDSSLSQWEAYGSISETGLTYDITTSSREYGDGSLRVAENVVSEIDENIRYGGVYVSASSLGREDFGGCTVQMSFMFEGEAAEAAEAFTLFSDGMVWVTSEVSAENNGRWSKISLTVPENAKNDKVGFTIPVFTPYSGTVVYVDNVMIYDENGNLIPNVGDYNISSASIEVSIGTGGRIALIILLVVLAVGVVVGIGYIVSSFLKKFI